MLSKTTYDSLHAALVVQNGIDIVVTEDVENWSKILIAWQRIKEKYRIKDLVALSPTKGIVKIN